MIKIEQIQPPLKLPGLSSFTVSFDYDKRLVDTIKQVPNAIWHQKQSVWEIPLTSLSSAVTLLTNYDDVEVKLLYDDVYDGDVIYKLHEDSYKATLFKHQKEGIQYGLNHDRWLLLDAPGLGKTLQMIYLAEELKRKENIEHCFIICGINTLKHNWKNEINKFSNYECKILGERTNKKGKTKIGSVKDRVEDLKNPIEEFFVVTNIQTIRNSDIVSAIKNGPNKFDLIIVDEIHTCLEYDTIVKTDIGDLKLGDIVENQISCNVLSYDKDKGQVVYNKILDYHKYYTDELLELTFEDEFTGILYTLRCTPNHKIYTKNRGYVIAAEIDESDIVEFIKN